MAQSALARMKIQRKQTTPSERLALSDQHIYLLYTRRRHLARPVIYYFHCGLKKMVGRLNRLSATMSSDAAVAVVLGDKTYAKYSSNLCTVPRFM